MILIFLALIVITLITSFPTIAVVALGALIAKKSRFSLPVKVTIAILIPIIITYAFRIPGMISDYIYKFNNFIYEIESSTIVKFNESIFISANKDFIKARYNYLDTVSLDCDHNLEFSFDLPGIYKDNYIDHIARNPISLTKVDVNSADVKIYIDAHEDEKHSYIDLKILKNGVQKARLRKRFRKVFHFERSFPLFAYLTENTFFNLSGLMEHKRDEVSDFLDKALNFSQENEKANISSIEMEANVERLDSKPIFKPYLSDWKKYAPEPWDSLDDTYCDGKVKFKHSKKIKHRSDNPKWNDNFKGIIEDRLLLITNDQKSIHASIIPTTKTGFKLRPIILDVNCNSDEIKLLIRLYPEDQMRNDLICTVHIWILKFSWNGKLISNEYFKLPNMPTGIGNDGYIVSKTNETNKLYRIELTHYAQLTDIERKETGYQMKYDSKYLITLHKDLYK